MYYPSIARSTHSYNNVVFAVAYHSYKVGDYEAINSENRHGWYTGDGMEYMYLNDNSHYLGMWPTVDPYAM